MKKILFVCTGNIFRSLSAERLAAKYDKENYIFSSAGIEAKPQTIHYVVVEELQKRGIDTFDHQQRKLSQEIINHSDIVIAMSTDHRDFIKQTFGYNAHLYNKIILGTDTPFLDANEIGIDSYHDDHPEVHNYIRKVIATIDSQMPSLALKLPNIFNSQERKNYE